MWKTELTSPTKELDQPAKTIDKPNVWSQTANYNIRVK